MIWLVDLVIAATVLEAIALPLWRSRTGHGLPARDLLPNLAAGLALALAVRGALAGWAAVWIAACLLAAGIAHFADLRRRWPH